MRFLITAGPTYEPIDAVRFIGNRSSGRMGLAIAEAALAASHAVMLCLGPVALAPPAAASVQRFRSSDDLREALQRHHADADVIVMAAAVADYKPARPLATKLHRDQPPDLDLVPTRDLLAELAAHRTAGQLLVGFALESRAELAVRAHQKLAAKGIDAIVANPLETMDSEEIEGELIWADGRERRPPGAARVTKGAFAEWLVETLAAEWTRLHVASGERR